MELPNKTLVQREGEFTGVSDAASLPWLCSREGGGDAAVTERGLVFEDFADKVDEVFVISQEGLPAIPLTLKEAELLNPAMAPPGMRAQAPPPACRGTGA